MEMIRILGTGMILVSSGWVGLRASLSLGQTFDCMGELRAALRRITGEVAYAGTPFVPLCLRAAEESRGSLRAFFQALSRAGEAEGSLGEGVTRRAAAEAGLTLPEPTLRTLEILFDGFGLGDRETQLNQLRLAGEEVDRQTAELRQQMAGRCRSYRLLGFCAGAAVLVLVL